MAQTNLEGEFLKAWKMYAKGYSKPVRQYMFHPTRKYRADFGFVDEKVLVEIMGTRSARSAHTTVMGYHSDCIRMCQAQALGWAILYIDSMFDQDWRLAVQLVKDVLDVRKL